MATCRSPLRIPQDLQFFRRLRSRVLTKQLSSQQRAARAKERKVVSLGVRPEP